MRKKRGLWNLVCPQPPKSIFLIVLSTSKMDCAGICVLPQPGVFNAAGCGMAVSVLQNEIAKIMQNEIAKGHIYLLQGKHFQPLSGQSVQSVSNIKLT